MHPLAHRGRDHMVDPKHLSSFQAGCLRSSSNDVPVPSGERERGYMEREAQSIN